MRSLYGKDREVRNADVQENVSVEQHGYSKVSVGRGEPVGIAL